MPTASNDASVAPVQEFGHVRNTHRSTVSRWRATARKAEATRNTSTDRVSAARRKMPRQRRSRHIMRPALLAFPPLPDRPAVGTFYRRPCVRAHWPGKHTRWLPVIGPAHSDREHIRAEFQHVHVDYRFLNMEIREHLDRLLNDSPDDPPSTAFIRYQYPTFGQRGVKSRWRWTKSTSWKSSRSPGCPYVGASTKDLTLPTHTKRSGGSTASAKLTLSGPSSMGPSVPTGAPTSQALRRTATESSRVHSTGCGGALVPAGPSRLRR